MITAILSPFTQVISIYKERRDLADKLVHLKDEQSRIHDRLIFLKDNDPQNLSPEAVLRQCPPEVRSTFCAMLDMPSTASEAILVSALRNEARGMWGKLSKRAGPTYQDVLVMVTAKLGLPKNGSVYQLEQSITIKIFNDMWQHLPQEKQSEILRKMQVEQSKEADFLPGNFAFPAIAAGGIVAAQASGFGVFLAASTIMATATSAIGITLPFVMYTAMSKAIAFVIGPPGWVALGGYALHTLSRDHRNYTKLGYGIALLAGMRAMQQLQWQVEYDETNVKLHHTENQICIAEDRRHHAHSQYVSAIAKIALFFLVVIGFSFWLIFKMLFG